MSYNSRILIVKIHEILKISIFMVGLYCGNIGNKSTGMKFGEVSKGGNDNSRKYF